MTTKKEEKKCETCSRIIPHDEFPDCYKDMPTPKQESWKEELCDKFPNMTQDINSLFKNDLYSFISNLLLAERKKFVEEIKKIPRRNVENETMIEGKTRYSRSAEAYNQALDKVISLLSPSTQQPLAE